MRRPRTWGNRLLVLYALAFVPPAAGTDIAFQSGVNIAVGSAPAAFALARIDGQRLIVARDQGLALVGPMGDPFPVATRLAAIQFVKSLALGPFTRPGALDVACLSGNEPVLHLLPGSGTRELGRPIEIELPARPSLLRAEDTGEADAARLFVAHEAGISLLRSEGSRLRVQPVVEGQFISDFQVADLDGDQNPDLVAVESHSSRLLILGGGGDGSFHNSRRVPTVAEPSSLFVGDVDGDRRPDVLVRGQSGIAVHVRDVEGAYLPPKILFPQAQLGGLAGADLDGDGHLDLVVTDPLRGTVTVLLNGGNGAFELRRSYSVGGGATALILADVTDDARTDILTLNHAADTVTLLRGRGDGRFDGAPAIVGATSEFTAMALADFDADERLDIAVTSELGGSLFVFLGNGEGEFAALPPLKLGGQPRALVVGELTGNGFPDLAVADFGRDQVMILAGTDRGSFEAPQRIAVGQGPVALAIGDFQGQGMHDLAVANMVSDTVSILYGDGRGRFPRVEHFPVNPRPTFLVVGDLNRDNHTDLVVGNDYSNTVSVLKGDGRSLGAPATQELAGSARLPLAEDLNRDGFVDLVLVNEDAKAVDVLPGRRGGGFGDRIGFPVGQKPNAVVSGDIDGDGLLDIAVLHGSPPAITILLNRSNRRSDPWREASSAPAR
jgi:hypothetical protein